jgi:hypothetical protein
MGGNDTIRRRAARAMGAGLALLVGASPAAADNPTQRSEGAVQAVPSPDPAEDESKGEEAVARREESMGRRFDPAFREVLKRSLAAGPEAPPRLDPGDAGTDLVFTPVLPCRVLDTRVAGGPLPAGGQRAIRVAGDLPGQGGASNCGVPLGAATAAVLNFVAVAPQSAGNLRAWPFGGAVPAASIINYAPVVGLNIANGLVMGLCNPAAGACPNDLTLQADVGATQVVIDVVGYFRAVRLPIFVAGNWVLTTVPPAGSAATQLIALTVTPALNGFTRLRARGYCNMAGLAGATNEIHLAIGVDAADAFNVSANPVSNWSVMVVPSGAPLARHTHTFTAERFVPATAGGTAVYRVFARHQTGAVTDDCSGTFFIETSF